MDHSLFGSPSDVITWGDIKSFLDQQNEETSVLDYMEIRSDKDFDGVLQTIVAMANTDGGIILAGVSKNPNETNKPGDPVGIDPKLIDSLKNKCRSLLQPAFLPEILPFPIPGKEKIILLIRINPDLHPQPVLLKEKGVLVRVGDSNRHADLYRLQQLFSETPRNAIPVASRGSFPPDSFLPLGMDHDLMIRFVLTGIGARSLSFNSTMKNQVLDALKQCPVEKWVRSFTRPVSWRFVSPMYSNMLTLLNPASKDWGELPGRAMPNLAIGARLHISLPGLQKFGVVLLDIWIKDLPKQESAPAWYPLQLDVFYELLLTGLRTVTDPGLRQQLPEGFLLWSRQLSVHVAAKKTPWLYLSGLSCVEPMRAFENFQAEAEFSESQRFTELDRIAKDGLCTLLTNSGCMDHEAQIQSMKSPIF